MPQLSLLSPEIEAVENEIRRLQQHKKDAANKLPFTCLRQGHDPNSAFTSRKVKKREEGEHANLAVAETMVVAAIRSLTQHSPWSVTPEDLHVHQFAGDVPLEVCLLVDTSGSMNGRRIREVRLLAEQLIQQMHEPITLITFQEGNIGVQVKSSRNPIQLRARLAAIEASGLTPMGEAIRTAVNYCKSRRGKKHLILLITDGLPTWAEGEKDPFLDAIEAAQLIKKQKMHMICIGLEPQRLFLTTLADTADASLYIMDDLEHSEIIAITRRERSRLLQTIPAAP